MGSQHYSTEFRMQPYEQWKLRKSKREREKNEMIKPNTVFVTVEEAGLGDCCIAYEIMKNKIMLNISIAGFYLYPNAVRVQLHTKHDSDANESQSQSTTKHTHSKIQRKLK